MTSLEAALRRVTGELDDAHIPFALIGGLAVSVRTEPRFTRDADLAVALGTDAEAEALISRLRSRGHGIEAIVEQEAAGRLATVRLTRSSDSAAPVVDLLFASSGIESEVVADADEIELLPHFTIRVATVGHLIALKVLSRDDEDRPQDIVDLVRLNEVATATDRARVRELVELIERRGYHRNRPLREQLDDLLRTAP